MKVEEEIFEKLKEAHHLALNSKELYDEGVTKKCLELSEWLYDYFTLVKQVAESRKDIAKTNKVYTADELMKLLKL